MWLGKSGTAYLIPNDVAGRALMARMFRRTPLQLAEAAWLKARHDTERFYSFTWHGVSSTPEGIGAIIEGRAPPAMPGWATVEFYSLKAAERRAMDHYQTLRRKPHD